MPFQPQILDIEELYALLDSDEGEYTIGNKTYGDDNIEKIVSTLSVFKKSYIVDTKIRVKDHTKLLTDRRILDRFLPIEYTFRKRKSTEFYNIKSDYGKFEFSKLIERVSYQEQFNLRTLRRKNTPDRFNQEMADYLKLLRSIVDLLMEDISKNTVYPIRVETQDNKRIKLNLESDLKLISMYGALDTD